MSSPILVPKLNENDDAVQLLELLVPEGGHVEVDEPFFTVETSKASVDIIAENAGYVHWVSQAGDTVPMPSTIGFIGASVEEAKAATLGSEVALGSPIAPVGESLGAGETVRATRAARQLASNLGVNLGDIKVPGIVREVDVRRLAGLAAGPTPTTRPSPARPEPKRTMISQDQHGRLDAEFLSYIEANRAEFGQLRSEFKIWLYQKHGAVIGENVRIGLGTTIQAEFVEVGDDTVLEEGIDVRCRRFSIGQLGLVGSNCRFFCRDFVAGDVVTLQWNVAVVDGEGGIHDCHIGDLTFIAYDCYVNTFRDVTLGENVCLSPGARIYTHRKWLDATDGFPYAYAAVEISDRCWLGPASLVLPGVRLSEEVTVMANSVVANNVASGALVGGIPASVILAHQKKDLGDEGRARVVVEMLSDGMDDLGSQGWSMSAAEAENVRVDIGLDWNKSAVVRAIAMDNVGGVRVGLQWSSFERTTSFHSKNDHVFFCWGEDQRRAMEQSRGCVEHVLVSGYIYDRYLNSQAPLAREVKERLESRGARFVVGLFDERPNEIFYPKEVIEDLYRGLLDECLADPTLGLIIKPKDSSPFDQLDGVRLLLEEAKATGRCLVLEEDSDFRRERWRNNNLFALLPALASDLTVSVSFTTPGRESALAGTRAVYYDYLYLKDHPIYESDASTDLAFRDTSSLIQAVRSHRHGDRPGLGDHSTILDDIDPYRDGRAGQRVGDYVRWLLDSFDGGHSREKALASANSRYAGRSGRARDLIASHAGRS